MKSSKNRDVLVIGATGETGRHVYSECVARGLVVEAMVRDIAKGRDILGKDASLIKGDLTDIDSLDSALKGIKRVIMAVGQRRGDENSTAERVCFHGVKNLAFAAKRHEVEKIVHLTSNGVDSPDRWIIIFLNYLTGMGPAWKLRGEEVLRESGVPYVVVRPVGLKNKDGDVCPIIKQCKPYEWGACMIGRKVVGKILVEAMLEEKCTNRTLNCRENLNEKKSLKYFDWAEALCNLSPDKPIPVILFDEHFQALERWKTRVKNVSIILMGVASLGFALWRSRK